VSYRLIGIVAMAVCVVSICLVVLVVILRGGVTTTAPSIVGLVSFIGLLVSSIASIATVRDVQQKLNGHLHNHAAETRVLREELEKVQALLVESKAREAP
jgi:hypothetical protein